MIEMGTILANYRIKNLLGTGGMGEVYLAEETLLGRQVAIKRLNPLLTNDPQFSERFVNEARIQAQLVHPNIVALYNFFIEDGIYYMVMEYAEGNMLKEVIGMTGPIPEQRSLHIFKQIISALGYAHAKQIIHRDIKPSNIMIDANDNVKVMDFGIARLMSDKHLTRTGSKLGTLYYMSPEQVMAAKDIDHRTDIYSAGIVLFEMLTGKPPFTADTDSDFIVMKEITENTLPDPRISYPHISDNTVSVMIKATHKQREYRYQDCSVLHNDCCGEGMVGHSDSPIFENKPIENGLSLNVIDDNDEQERNLRWAKSCRKLPTILMFSSIGASLLPTVISIQNGEVSILWVATIIGSAALQKVASTKQNLRSLSYEWLWYSLITYWFVSFWEGLTYVVWSNNEFTVIPFTIFIGFQVATVISVNLIVYRRILANADWDNQGEVARIKRIYFSLAIVSLVTVVLLLFGIDI